MPHNVKVQLSLKQRSESRRQKTDDRKQKTENRSQINEFEIPPEDGKIWTRRRSILKLYIQPINAVYPSTAIN